MAYDTTTASVREMSGRVPPHAAEVEMSVLGAMMRDAGAVGDVIEILRPEDFYKPAHRKTYDAMLRLFGRSDPIDIATVANELEQSGDLETCGGRASLIDIADSVYTSANAITHARIVQDKSVLRQMISASGRIMDKCHTAPGEVADLLDDAERQIFAISESRVRQDFVSLETLLPETFDAIEEFHRTGGGITGLSTGFPDLDEKTAGLQNGDLVILAGRPSMGKTAFALTLMDHIGVDQKKACAIFSLEMSRNQLAQRMLCSRARISAHHMRTGRLRPEEYSKLSVAVGPLSEAPIYIDDSAALSVLELRSKARRLKAQQNLGLVVVDYMQMMQGHRAVDNRQQEIAMISSSLKALAKELSIPVLALSQLSRQVEQRGGDRRPQLSDLRESGAIEQDADVVMFVYRPERYGITSTKEGQNIENLAEIIISKQRNGPTGTVHLSFIKEYARFESRAKGDSPGFAPAQTPEADVPF